MDTKMQTQTQKCRRKSLGPAGLEKISFARKRKRYRHSLKVMNMAQIWSKWVVVLFAPVHVYRDRVLKSPDIKATYTLRPPIFKEFWVFPITILG